jgi:hypothetical protein
MQLTARLFGGAAARPARPIAGQPPVAYWAADPADLMAQLASRP